MVVLNNVAIPTRLSFFLNSLKNNFVKNNSTATFL